MGVDWRFNSTVNETTNPFIYRQGNPVADVWAPSQVCRLTCGLIRVAPFIIAGYIKYLTFLRCNIMLTVSKTSQNHVSVKIFRS